MSESKKRNSYLKHDKKLAILRKLLDRENIYDDAFSRLQTAYTHAPKNMINSAVFHLYIEGVHAAIDWLVDAELFLQNPKNNLCESKTYHLIYNLYNWLQFKAILQDSNENLIEKINDIKAAIKDDDWDAALDILEELKDKFNGDITPPNFS